MKKYYYFISLFLFTTFSLNAQYSMFPASPLQVCQATGNQTSVQAFNKGNFTYVYWLDNRSGKNEVYGQKLDAGGNPQWTANGKLIASMNGSLLAFRVTAWQNGTFMSYMSNDSCLGKYINGTGNDVWSQPTLIAKTGNGVIYMDSPGYNVFPNDSGITITHGIIYTGGSELFTFNRIDVNGNLRWAPLNFSMTLQGYDYRTAADNQNGFYVLSKGNGLGSTMYIKRFDLQGTSLWPSAIDITSGNPAIGFGGNIYMQADSAANLFVCWEGNQGSVQTAKITPNGAFAWSSQRVLVNAPAATSPRRPASKFVNNKLYVTWIEDINGSSYCQIQKLDTAGNAEFPTAGVMVDTINYYYCYPKIALSDSGAVAVFYNSSTGVHFAAQRIRSNGTVSWADGVDICTAGWQGYADYTPIDDVNGCNPVFWSSSGTPDILGARICSDATLVSVFETPGQLTNVHVYPNPAHTYVRFEQLNNTMKAVYLYDMSGRLSTVQPIRQGAATIVSTEELQPGLYTYQIKGENQELMSTGKLVIE